MRPLIPSKAIKIIRSLFSTKQHVKREKIKIDGKRSFEQEVGMIKFIENYQQLVLNHRVGNLSPIMISIFKHNIYNNWH